MANAMAVKEYLVALGFQDNATPQMRRTFSIGQRMAQQFGRGLMIAGTAAAGLLIAANAGVARFVSGLVRADDELNHFAQEMGKGREEAQRLHMTLRTMGHTLEEIEANPELQRQFQRLQEDAAAIQLPDMSEGLAQVRGIQTEFLRFRQAGANAVQWVGYYLLKYLAQPMQNLRDTFSGLNDRLIANMPEWSKRIAGVMASVVRITQSIIRGASAIFRALRRIFDMIPTEIKILTGVLTAFAGFIRAGPIGKLMMAFSLLMLLVEDFFTYFDGGEALLGGFWRLLIDLWETINEGGWFVNALKTAFTAAMDAIVRAVRWVIDWIVGLFARMRDLGAINNFRDAFSRVGTALGAVFGALRDVFNLLFRSFQDGAETAQPFLAWLLGVALPRIIGLVANVVTWVAQAVSRFTEMEHAGIVIKALAVAIGSVIAAMKLWALWQGIVNKVALLNPKVLILAAVIAAITAIIAGVALLIRNWKSVADFFRNLWDRITGVFRDAWGVIVGVFSSVDEFFSNIFGRAADGIRNAFSGLREFFSNLFQAIGNIVRAPINAIIRGINTFIGSLNRIQIPNWVPGVGGRGLNFPKVPELERGGVLKKGQTGYLEGKGTEAVVPLEKNTEWVTKVAGLFKRELASGKSGGIYFNPIQKVADSLNKAVQVLSQVSSALGAMDKGLNHGAAAYATNYSTSTYNIDMKSSYTISDTSGNPQSVASAVDRKKQMMLRNLRGILNTA